MPSLNLTKEDVNKQLADLRESLVSAVDRRIAEIQQDVAIVNDVRSKGAPHHADGVISTVSDIMVGKNDFRAVKQIYGVNIGNFQLASMEIPAVELAPGRYRVFIHVHKVPE